MNAERIVRIDSSTEEKIFKKNLVNMKNKIDKAWDISRKLQKTYLDNINIHVGVYNETRK